MIVKKCDVCGKNVKPATNEAQANRNLGLHKRVVHGIKSTKKSYYIPAAERAGHAQVGKAEKKSAADPSVREQRKRWYIAKKLREEMKDQSRKNAEPMGLTQCPYCHATFWGVRGTQENPETNKG